MRGRIRKREMMRRRTLLLAERYHRGQASEEEAREYEEKQGRLKKYLEELTRFDLPMAS